MDGNMISCTQNETQNINLLAAQKQLYFEAKKITFCQFIINVLVPMTFPFLKRKFSDNYKGLAFISLFSMVILTLDFFYFEKVIENKKEKAAKVQELFDTDVLQLSWNSDLCGSKETAFSDVQNKARKYKKRKKTMEDLVNWYSEEYSTVDIYSGRIMCQKSNISWDKELRQNFQTLVCIIAIVCTLFIFIISIIENLSFAETIITILAPLFPILLYIFKRYGKNKSTMIQVEKLNHKSETLWEQILNSSTSKQDLEIRSRKFQNDIYKYRSSALMIWDWFYFLKRTNQEDAMKETAKNMVCEYKKTRLYKA